MAYADTKYGGFFYFEQDTIGRAIAAGEFWDPHLKPYLDELGPDSVMVDAGANIGFHTIYAALGRGATVHAFEASFEVFCLLKRNLAKNRAANVVEYNTALYDRFTTLDINPQWIDWVATADNCVDYERSPNSGGLSLVRTVKGRWQARPLDYWQIERVDLLKVDVQGCDFRVLLGARETIRRSWPTICFEFEHNGSGANASGDRFEAFEGYLTGAFGYKIKEIGGNGSTWVDYVAEP